MRPLRAGDLAMLHGWHQAPHLRPFYMWGDAISAVEITRKFTPRLDPTHSVRCRIAEFDGTPYGFIQWYPSRHWPDCGAMKTGLIDTCSADYFIGDPRWLGRGLAAAMLRLAFSEVVTVMPPDQRALCLAHNAANTSAIRAASAAGFNAEATYGDDAGASTVYVRRA